jgi:hypothetical protein
LSVPSVLSNRIPTVAEHSHLSMENIYQALADFKKRSGNSKR